MLIFHHFDTVFALILHHFESLRGLSDFHWMNGKNFLQIITNLAHQQNDFTVK